MRDLLEILLDRCSDVYIDAFARGCKDSANLQLTVQVREWEKDTIFPVGFYQSLRAHGIYIHGIYNP